MGFYSQKILIKKNFALNLNAKFCAALLPNNVCVGQFILSLVIFFSVFVACVSLKSKQGYSVKEK